MSKRLGEEFKSEVSDSAKVVEELRLSQRAQVQTLRNVLDVPAGIAVRPANSAERCANTMAGSCREVRSTSVVAVLSQPVAVGSFFQLSFDTEQLDLPPTFGRCDRCSLLAEDEFEVRFHFLQPIVLPTSGSTSRA